MIKVYFIVSCLFLGHSFWSENVEGSLIIDKENHIRGSLIYLLKAWI